MCVCIGVRGAPRRVLTAGERNAARALTRGTACAEGGVDQGFGFRWGLVSFTDQNQHCHHVFPAVMAFRG